MDNELTIGKKSVVAIMQNRELGEIIKPLSREIFLFDTFHCRYYTFGRYERS